MRFNFSRSAQLLLIAVLGLAGAMGACRASSESLVAQPSLAPFRREGLQELRDQLAEFSQREDYLGSVALVSRGSQRLWRGQSMATPASEAEAYDIDTIFPIYSMTKAITSVVVLQLAEEGRLSIDDPISHTLPEFAQPVVYVMDADGAILGTRPAAREITIADLLSHTAGYCYEFLESGALKEVYESANLTEGVLSARDAARRIAKLGLAFDPGTEWRYGRSTDVLGALVEELEGKSLQQVMEARVFTPLGMGDTAFFVPDSKRARLCLRALDRSGAQGVRSVPFDAPTREPAYCSAGGGLYSTAADFHRFCEMLLGKGQREGVRLLSEQSLTALTTDRSAGLPRPFMLGKRGFGLGVAVLTEESAGPLNGSVGAFHWSGIAGTSFFVDPAHSLIGVFMTYQLRDYSYMTAFRKATYAALPQ